MNNLEQYIGDLNPSCWLNADHVYGFSTLQPNIGDDVNTWVDSSGNGNHFKHEVIETYNPPKFGQDTLYGQTKSCLTFDSNFKQTLIPSAVNTIWGNAFTLVRVSKYSNGWIFQNKYGGALQGNIQLSYRITGYVDYPQVEQDLRHFVRTNFDTVIVKRGLGVFTGQSIFTQNSYLDKSNTSSVESSARDSNFENAESMSIGGRRLVYNGAYYDNLFTGSVFEIVAFSRIITQSETSQVQSYLKQKYNI